VRRIAIFLGHARVGQLDRGDEAIAKLAREAAFQEDRDGRIAELGWRPA